MLTSLKMYHEQYGNYVGAALSIRAKVMCSEGPKLGQYNNRVMTRLHPFIVEGAIEQIKAQFLDDLVIAERRLYYRWARGE